MKFLKFQRRERERQKGAVAQSEECNVSNVEAPGSKPGSSTTCVYTSARIAGHVRTSVSMAEWLRRQIRNLMGFARGGSNPSAVVIIPAGIAHYILLAIAQLVERGTVMR